jgi:hypothetical protein
MSLPHITVFSIFGTHRLHESVRRVTRANPSNPDKSRSQPLTIKSRSASVIQTRSTFCTNASNTSGSSADRDMVLVSTATSGLRLSMRAFAASTRYNKIVMSYARSALEGGTK